MELEWIVSEPIDFEYKQYQLLAYLQNIDRKFDNFQIYPAFKELSIHLANIKSIATDGTYIKIKKDFTEIDEEILMGDLTFINLPKIKKDESEEFYKSVRFAENKITEYFLIGKSLWSLINESIEIKNVYHKSNLKENFGFIVINYDGVKFVYQYELTTSGGKSKDRNIKMENIYIGNGEDIHQIILENCNNDNYAFNARFTSVSLPIFDIDVNQRSDYEYSVKPLVKRKVLSYINQNIRTGNVEF